MTTKSSRKEYKVTKATKLEATTNWSASRLQALTAPTSWVGLTSYESDSDFRYILPDCLSHYCVTCRQMWYFLLHFWLESWIRRSWASTIWIYEHRDHSNIKRKEEKKKTLCVVFRFLLYLKPQYQFMSINCAAFLSRKYIQTRTEARLCQAIFHQPVKKPNEQIACSWYIVAIRLLGCVSHKNINLLGPVNLTCFW